MAITSTKAATGGMNAEKVVLKWTIDNFDAVRQSKQLIDAQKLEFQVGKTLGFDTDWAVYLICEPDRRTGDTEEKMWIGCFLRLLRRPCPDDDKEILAAWKFKICNWRQENFHIKSFKVEDYKKTWVSNLHGRGFKWIIPQDAVTTNLPLIQGALVLELEVRVFAPKPVSILNDSAEIQATYQSKFMEKLSQDLTKMLSDPAENCDAKTTIMVTADGKEFRICRGVLSARSPVFEKMFQTRMSEAETGIIRITDISSKTMTVLLRYIYAGTLHSDWRDSDVVPELAYAAHKYQLEMLLEFLDQAIGSLCTKENAGKLINLAVKLSMKKAENDLFVFAQKNISTLREWMDLFTGDVLE